LTLDATKVTVDYERVTDRLVIDTCPTLDGNINALGQLLRHTEILKIYQSINQDSTTEKLVNESETSEILL
jgi:hypothetical protein